LFGGRPAGAAVGNSDTRIFRSIVRTF
jgi:hypothetical protein